MVLTKRERILVIVTAVALGALVINQIVIKPLSAWRKETEDEKFELQAQVEEARSLSDRRVLLEGKWKNLLVGMKSDADAESRIARALDEWSRQTGFSLVSTKPARSVTEKGMNEITFRVAGRGQMESVMSFVYKVETSELPVKVKSVQLGSESGDNLSLELVVSAIYLGSVQKASDTTPQQQPEANDDEEVL